MKTKLRVKRMTNAFQEPKEIGYGVWTMPVNPGYSDDFCSVIGFSKESCQCMAIAQEINFLSINRLN